MDDFYRFYMEMNLTLPTAVKLITDDGMADVGHVAANLMAASGFKFQFNKGIFTALYRLRPPVRLL